MFKCSGIRICIYMVVSWSVLTTGLAKTCVGQGQCACQFDDDNSMIDLTSLGNTDDTPRFKDITAADGSGTYSYNPCYPFDEGPDCSGAAACMTDNVGSTDVIGTPQPVKFDYDGSNLYVGYDAGSGILTVTEVNLVCDQNACEPSFSVQGEQSANRFTMTMTTVCACPNGCDDSGPINCKSAAASASIGGGVIFLIIFFVLIVVYFVGGAVFMKVGRKASGSEIIPNVSFWKALPSLVKDGCLYTLKPCRRGGYTQK